MIEISKDEINGLIRKYLEDEGYFHTLYTFRNEAVPSEKSLSQTLTSLITKGLQYLYGCQHLQGSKIIPCKNKFCLSEEHLCSEDASIGRGSPAGSAGTRGYSRQVDLTEGDLSGVGDSKLACWNGDRLAICTSSNELLAFHLGNFLWRKEINNMTALSWHNEDLVVGNGGGEVITINVLNNRTRSYVCHGAAVTSIRQRGKGILSTGADGHMTVMNNGVKDITVSECPITDSVWMADAEAGCILADLSVVFVDVEASDVSRLGGHKDKITNLEYNGQVMSTSSHDGTIGLWTTATMTGSYIRAHDAHVNDHKWIGGRIVSCGSDGRMKLWDTERSMEVFRLDHLGSVVTIDCSSDLIASGSSNGLITISDPRHGEICRHVAGGNITKVLFSHDGSTLCVCSSASPPKMINLRYSKL